MTPEETYKKSEETYKKRQDFRVKAIIAGGLAGLVVAGFRTSDTNKVMIHVLIGAGVSVVLTQLFILPNMYPFEKQK